MENYIKYRPGYPPAILDLLAKKCGLTSHSTVADIGSGTGLLARSFLDFGCEVTGVEPNPGMRAAGIVLLVLGLVPLVESFARFVWKGLGTPAPIFPTRYLVVSGLYRYLRNPMYVAVVTIVLGEALLAGSRPPVSSPLVSVSQ